MEGGRRDSTQDWLLPARSAPTLGELEARIADAVTIARASEDAVRVVGDAALDAAAQARRAAELAERASAAALELAGAERVPAPGEDPRLRRFSERADRVMRRLQAIERLRGGHPAVGLAGRRRGAG